MCLFSSGFKSSIFQLISHLILFQQSTPEYVSTLLAKILHKPMKKKMFAEQRGPEGWRTSSELFPFIFLFWYLILQKANRVLLGSQKWLGKFLCCLGGLSEEDSHCHNSLHLLHLSIKDTGDLKAPRYSEPGRRRDWTVDSFLLCISTVSFFSLYVLWVTSQPTALFLMRGCTSASY